MPHTIMVKDFCKDGMIDDANVANAIIRHAAPKIKEMDILVDFESIDTISLGFLKKFAGLLYKHTKDIPTRKFLVKINPTHGDTIQKFVREIVDAKKEEDSATRT